MKSRGLCDVENCGVHLRTRFEMNPITSSITTQISVAAGAGYVREDIRKDSNNNIINMMRIRNTAPRDREGMKFLVGERPREIGSLKEIESKMPREIKHINRVADCINRIMNDTKNTRDQRNTVQHLYLHGGRWLNGEYSNTTRSDDCRVSAEKKLRGGISFVYEKENYKPMPRIKL